MRTAGALGRRGADAEGTRVRFDHTIHVPEDEICFFVFDAPSSREAASRGAAGRARPLRVVEAVSSGKE